MLNSRLAGASPAFNTFKHATVAAAGIGASPTTLVDLGVDLVYTDIGVRNSTDADVLLTFEVIGGNTGRNELYVFAGTYLGLQSSLMQGVVKVSRATVTAPSTGDLTVTFA